MKRHSLTFIKVKGGKFVEPVFERKDGEWVRYKDVKKYLPKPKVKLTREEALKLPWPGKIYGLWL